MSLERMQVTKLFQLGRMVTSSQSHLWSWTVHGHCSPGDAHDREFRHSDDDDSAKSSCRFCAL